MLLYPRELAWFRSSVCPWSPNPMHTFPGLHWLDFSGHWHSLEFPPWNCASFGFCGKSGLFLIFLPLKYLCSWSMCILPKAVPLTRRQDIVMPKSLNSGTRLPRLESWLFHLDQLLYLLMPQFCHGKMGMLLVVSHSVVVKIRLFNIHNVPRIVPRKWQMFCKSLLWKRERGKKTVGEREREGTLWLKIFEWLWSSAGISEQGLNIHAQEIQGT